MKLISIHDNTQYGKGNVVRHEPAQTWVKILAIDPICRVVTVRWPDGRQQHVTPEELEMRFVEGWAGRVLVKPETDFVNEPSTLMQSMSQSDAERLSARDMHGARAGVKQAEMVMPGPYGAIQKGAQVGMTESSMRMMLAMNGINLVEIDEEERLTLTGALGCLLERSDVEHEASLKALIQKLEAV